MKKLEKIGGIFEKHVVEKEHSLSYQPSTNRAYYAYGNTELKTWFISPQKIAIMPKGSRLLFVITADKVEIQPINTKETYPSVGDVVSDVYGNYLKIKDVKWI